MFYRYINVQIIQSFVQESHPGAYSRKIVLSFSSILAGNREAGNPQGDAESMVALGDLVPPSFHRKCGIRLY